MRTQGNRFADLVTKRPGGRKAMAMHKSVRNAMKRSKQRARRR